MNRIAFLIIVAALIFGGCKSKKELPQSQYTADPATQPKVFTVPGTTTEETTRQEPKQEVKEEPV